MAGSKHVRASLIEVEACRGESGCGVLLGFRPERTRLDVDYVSDFASLGPEHCIPAVRGVGKVIRILRAARLAVPEDPLCLLGEEQDTRARLERAIGVPLLLELRARSRIRFVAWREEGVETIENVSDVLETPHAFLIFFQRGNRPIRISRSEVVRQQTECERWFEVIGIKRVD